MDEESFECPICGAELEEGIEECPECGEPLIDEESFECPICGAELEEGIDECPECGEFFTDDKDKKKAVDRLMEISGLGKQRAIKLYEEGFENPEDILERGMEGIAGIDQIGVRTAEKIIDGAEQLVEKEGKDEEEVQKEFDEKEEISESEELTDKSEDEVVESITEDIKTTVEEDLEEKPKRVIIGENISKNLGDFIPILSAFLIPVFLLLLVASELMVTLLDYTSIYPAQSIYYLTPSPFVVSSWFASLVFSFLIVLALFVTTWIGFKFGSVPSLKLDKNMIFFSGLFSLIISVSLISHLYHSQIYSGIVLTIILLVLSLFMLISQFEILRKKNISFPKVIEKKACFECGGVMALELENCPRCGVEISVLEESISPKEDDWSLTLSSLTNKFRKEQKYVEEETISDIQEVPKSPEKEPEAIEEMPEQPEEEVTEPAKDIPPEPPELEGEEPGEGGRIFRPISKVADSIREGWSSTVSFLQRKLSRGSEEEGTVGEKGVCPSCHAVISAESEECPECGEELEPATERLEDEEVLDSKLKDLERSLEKVEEEETETSELVCSKCGAELEESVDECPECGEPLESEEDKAIEKLTEISGVGKSRAKKLYEEGFESPEDILEGGIRGLAGIDQIGIRRAERLIDEAEKLIEEKSSREKSEEEKETIEAEDLEEKIPESEGGITKTFSDIGDSVRKKLSSSSSFLQEKFRKLTKIIKNLKPSKKEEFEEIKEIEGVEEKTEEEEEVKDEEEIEEVPVDERDHSFHSFSPQTYEIEEGEKFDEETEEIVFVCPICDAELEGDVDECPECGTVFIEEEEEAEEEGIVEEVLKED